MFEIIKYIVAIIALLVLIVFLNHWTNSAKKERCEKMGGEFIYNSTDANLSMCRLNK